jgi:hypothetical protein
MIVGWGNRAKACVSALFVLALSPPSRQQFTPRLPDGVPSPNGWERIVGEEHLQDLTVWYEFYVNPERPALYQIVRYRMRPSRPDEGYRANERLQWHVSGTKILRRFECRETKVIQEVATACEWRELEPQSAEYRREAMVVIWLYGLHRRRLEVSASGSF